MAFAKLTSDDDGVPVGIAPPRGASHWLAACWGRTCPSPTRTLEWEARWKAAYITLAVGVSSAHSFPHSIVFAIFTLAHTHSQNGYSVDKVSLLQTASW